jgi:hypothetical protein
MGQQIYCHCPQCQGIRSTVHFKQSDSFEMATGTDYEWYADPLLENGTSYFSGFLVIPLPLRKLPEAFGLASSKSWYPLF